jgi:hypothetical protein
MLPTGIQTQDPVTARDLTTALSPKLVEFICSKYVDVTSLLTQRKVRNAILETIYTLPAVQKVVAFRTG